MSLFKEIAHANQLLEEKKKKASKHDSTPKKSHKEHKPRLRKPKTIPVLDHDIDPDSAEYQAHLQMIKDVDPTLYRKIINLD